MVSFQSNGVELPSIDMAKMSRWLTEVASSYGRRIGNMVYQFCDDKTILKTNREFLGHDYYTDVITFDYTVGDRVGGDILISLDTVASNAEELGVPYDEELKRVIVHGLLHLCGINDKGEGERAVMEAAENQALSLYDII